MESNNSAIEREVQRRVTSALSSAGVSSGMVTREVLFMLPPDFVRAYVKLFDRALRESVSGGSGRVDTAERKRVGKQNPARKANSRGAQGEGGKRFRLHWVIKDEIAFRYKSSVDRKLLRLAGKIDRDLSRKAETLEGDVRCTQCSLNLAGVIEEMGRITFCPRCGSKLNSGRLT